MALKKFASNVAYLAIDWFLITILSSLFWIISGKLLNSAELGIVATVFNLATTIQFFSTLGIGVALSKLISEYSYEHRESKILSISRPAIKLLAVSNILSLLIVFLFVQNLSLFFKLEPRIILITSIIATFLAINNITGFILVGFQNMRKFMLTNLFYHLSKVAISTVFVLVGFSFFGPLTGMIIGLIVLFLLRFDTLKIFKGSFKVRSNYKEVLKYSIPALVGGLSIIAFNNAPYIILTVIQDLSVTGIFTPAMLLATPLFILPNTFTAALFPIISGLSTKMKEDGENKYLISIAFRYTILLTLPLAIFLIFFSEQIITILFKPEYLQAVELLKILSIGALLQGLSGIFLSSIYALKRPNVQQNILIFVSILFIFLSLPFTYYLSATGMSIAYLLSASTLFLLSYFYVRKLVAIKLPYITIFKILIAAFLAISFIVLVKPMIPNLLSILLIIPSVLVYSLSLLFLNFYNSLDLRLISFLSKRAPRFLVIPLNLIYYLLKSRVN